MRSTQRGQIRELVLVVHVIFLVVGEVEQNGAERMGRSEDEMSFKEQSAGRARDPVASPSAV